MGKVFITAVMVLIGMSVSAEDYNYLTFETNVDSTNASFSDILATYSLPVTADDLIYSYKISVQTKENVSLATTSINIDPDLLASPRGLKAVVVSAELLDGPYVIATDSISYFYCWHCRVSATSSSGFLTRACCAFWP